MRTVDRFGSQAGDRKKIFGYAESARGTRKRKPTPRGIAMSRSCGNKSAASSLDEIGEWEKHWSKQERGGLHSLGRVKRGHVGASELEGLYDRGVRGHLWRTRTILEKGGTGFRGVTTRDRMEVKKFKTLPEGGELCQRVGWECNKKLSRARTRSKKDLRAKKTEMREREIPVAKRQRETWEKKSMGVDRLQKEEHSGDSMTREQNNNSQKGTSTSKPESSIYITN